MIPNIDDLGWQAMRGGQAAAAAAADVAAASTAPRPHHAAAPETPALALVAGLAAVDTRLPSPQKLDQNVPVSLGARPVERGKLEI